MLLTFTVPHEYVGALFDGKLMYGLLAIVQGEMASTHPRGTAHKAYHEALRSAVWLHAPYATDSTRMSLEEIGAEVSGHVDWENGTRAEQSFEGI